MKHNKEGSFSTHANRCKRLDQMFRQLSERYRHISSVHDLKQRHIDYLVERWKSEELSAGTIKNRMTDLRWVSQKIDKQNIVKRTNDEYGIERRTYTDNEKNIAKTLDDREMSRLNDPYVSRSLQLQEAFGLRREEAIKFQPEYADKGDHIKLKDTWCKGGRPREVPITNEKQRILLDDIKSFCKAKGSSALIPPGKNYKQQLKAYENHTERNAINNNHGLRHQYAQDRYKDLTGWECPKRGGQLARDMSPKQKEIDRHARLMVSSELGHNREEITNVYLGGKK